GRGPEDASRAAPDAGDRLVVLADGLALQREVEDELHGLAQRAERDGVLARLVARRRRRRLRAVPAGARQDEDDEREHEAGGHQNPPSTPTLGIVMGPTVWAVQPWRVHCDATASVDSV